MLNSWGKFPPSAIFKGTVADFADYDQCLAIKPNELIGKSQYCFINISRVPQGTSHQGGLTLKILKIQGRGVNSSDLMDNFWRSPHNFV